MPEQGQERRLIDAARRQVRRGAILDQQALAVDVPNGSNADSTVEFALGSTSPREPAMHVMIARFQVRRLLGQGGFGKVYLAFDPELERLVAIKVPHPHRIRSEADIEAYLTEARNAARLDHPHIVPVYDVGRTDDGLFYVVSKYIEGRDLRTYQREVELTFEQIATIVRQAAEALHHAHRRGLVHRDIKPGNILIDGDGRPHLVDFGMALRDDDFGRGPTSSGTPAYMSPEQARGEGHLVDARSDVYSLGVVLYELLAGCRPFEASNVPELIEQILTLEPRPPRQHNDRVPRELDAICLKALAKRQVERYSTTLDLAEDLKSYIARQMPVATRPPIPIRAEPGATFRLDESVQFTIYRPKQIRPAIWYRMLAFAHLSERRSDADPSEPDPVREVQNQARQVLGERISEYRQSTQDSSSAVPLDAQLTFVPEVAGVEFNPPSRSFHWLESVHREEFRLRARTEMEGQTARGRLCVFLGSILLAEVNLGIAVTSAAVEELPDLQSEHGRAFRRIFASYSPRDEVIVRQFEQFASLLGDEYHLGCSQLRAGDTWDVRIPKMINDADVFQLFWSTNALDTPTMQREWEYALSLNRPSFIRPVYWEEPMPRDESRDLPPPALRRLHFQRIGTIPSPKVGLPDGERYLEQILTSAPTRGQAGVNLVLEAFCTDLSPPAQVSNERRTDSKVSPQSIKPPPPPEAEAMGSFANAFPEVNFSDRTDSDIPSAEAGKRWSVPHDDPPDLSASTTLSGGRPPEDDADDRPDLTEVPEQIGDYAIVSKLARGALGVRYLARDIRSGIIVDLQVQPAEWPTKAHKSQFFQAAGKAKGLRHPNLLAVIDVFESESRLCTAVEHVEGQTLIELLRDIQCMEPAEALEIAKGVAAAVEAIHALRDIHGAVAPKNIWLTTSGAVKLSAWTRFLRRPLNPESGGWGYPHYSAVEQMMGNRPLDARTDVHSLGATLYYLVTGQTPFAGKTVLELMVNKMHSQFTSMDSILGPADRPFAAAIHRCLQADPDQRPASVGELLAELSADVSGRTTETSLPTGRSKTPRSAMRAAERASASSRSNSTFVVLLLTVAALAALLYYLFGVS